ncbi:MAG: hypothetical protein ABJQ29_06890 [Luteolibacter sp.]
MKTLLKVGALVVIAGVLGSCGIPMAAIRTAKNTPRTASNMINEVYRGNP